MIKIHSQPNDLIARIRADNFFAPIAGELDELLDPATFVGRAPEQVEKFLGKGGEVDLALREYGEGLGTGGERIELHV